MWVGYNVSDYFLRFGINQEMVPGNRMKPHKLTVEHAKALGSGSSIKIVFLLKFSTQKYMWFLKFYISTKLLRNKNNF